jgi:uncharacterized protein YdhG (YjbR/CyaY superfamily)
MRSFAKTYTRYLKDLTEDKREMIKKLGEFISKELPEATIEMKWGMPVFILNGEDVVAMAAQKQYFSFYVWKFDWRRKFASKIKKLNTGKECIRFTKYEKLPLELLQKLIMHSAEAD